MTLVPGENGCSVSVQDGSMKNALMMMMSTQTRVSFAHYVEILYVTSCSVVLLFSYFITYNLLCITFTLFDLY